VREISNVSSDAAELVKRDDVWWDSEFRDTKERIIAPPDVYGAKIADTHCHLDMLPHPELAIARALYHGIDFLITVVDPTESPEYTYENLSSWLEGAGQLLELWGSSEVEPPLAAPPQSPPTLRAIIGCHPHNAANYCDEIEAVLARYLTHPDTVALGEIGLDYHYDASPRDVQREVFKRQLHLAHTYSCPVALHLREAHDDGLAILDAQGWPTAGVLLHCYTLGPDEMQPFLAKGAYLAFGGTMTFKNAETVREAARVAPLDKIVTETDAPFMTPTPLRGTLCGPEHTRFTAAFLAETRGAYGEQATTELLGQLHRNAERFFRVTIPGQ